MYWGFTPAVDFQAELKENGKLFKEINILIVGGVDCRHVIKTAAQRYRHEKVKLNFYIMEAVLENVARQLLLLNVGLQLEEELGLVQKTRYFMELYGNILVRPAVAKYLKSRALEFVKMIANLDYMREIMPFIKLKLNNKEHDSLENVFKFWCNCDEFDICKYWNTGVRKSVGFHYDTRTGAFECDLHTRVQSVSGFEICSQDYTHWRATGVAFVWPESEVSKTNSSFVTAVITYGGRLGYYGFMGDVETGPFLTYGLDCEDSEYLKRSNGLNAHRATDVTERNLMQYFHELQKNDKYVHQKMSSIDMGHSTFVQTELKVVDCDDVGGIKKKKSEKCIDLDNVEINFISIDNLKLFKYMKDCHAFFNLIYFASTYLKYFDGDVIEMVAAENSLLMIENEIFVSCYRDRQIAAFEDQMHNKVETIKSKVNLPFNAKKDFYAKFVLKGNM